MNSLSESSTLHEALVAYAQRLKSEHEAGLYSMATFRDRQLATRRLKVHHDDLPLSSMTLDVCVEMIGLWRDRPVSTTTRKQLSASTAQRTLSELIRFFEWLDASDQFEWVSPSHFGQISRRIRS